MLDASAALELMLNTATGQRVAARIDHEFIHAPHLIDVEVTQVLRRLVSSREVAIARAERALGLWRQLDVERYEHEPFLPRIWALRANFSACDAAYIALAETLSTTVVTTDARLASAPGSRAKIELI